MKALSALGCVTAFITSTTLAVTNADYTAADLTPDMQYYQLKYGNLIARNDTERRIIVCNGGVDTGQRALDIQHFEAVTPAQDAMIRKHAMYLRVGSCFHSEVLNEKRFRNKCPDCGYRVLEAFKFDRVSTTPFVQYAFFGYDAANHTYVVGLWGELTPAELQRAIVAQPGGMRGFKRGGAISESYFQAFDHVRRRLNRTLTMYIQPLGTLVPQYITFVGHHAAAPVAEIMATQYRFQHPSMSVGLFTTGLPAYGDQQYEATFRKLWSGNPNMTRMVNTRDAIPQAHVDLDNSSVPLARSSTNEVMVHSQKYKIGVWLAHVNQSLWSTAPEYEPRLLHVAPGYRLNVYNCQSHGGCFERLLQHGFGDTSGRSNLYFDYYAPLDCGIKVGYDDVNPVEILYPEPPSPQPDLIIVDNAHTHNGTNKL